MINLILEMSLINEQYQDILKAIQKSNNTQTEELKKYINFELQGIKEEINREREKIVKLEENYTELNLKYKSLEKSLRKNNIIVFGLQYQNGNLLKYTLNKLNSHLQLNLIPGDINNIYTIGRKQEDKPIIVKFTSFLQKQSVLKNCSKLKSTNIKISDDLSIEELEKVRKLRKYLKIARSNNLTSYIRGIRLHVNGKWFSAEELNDTDFGNETNPTREEEEEEEEERKNGISEMQSENQTVNLYEKLGKKGKFAKVVTADTKTVIQLSQGRASSRLAGKSNIAEKS